MSQSLFDPLRSTFNRSATPGSNPEFIDQLTTLTSVTMPQRVEGQQVSNVGLQSSCVGPPTPFNIMMFRGFRSVF